MIRTILLLTCLCVLLCPVALADIDAPDHHVPLNCVNIDATKVPPGVSVDPSCIPSPP